MRCALLSSPLRASLLCRQSHLVKPIVDLLRLSQPAFVPHRPIWASIARMEAPASSSAAPPPEAAAAAAHGAESAPRGDAQKGQKRKADGQQQQSRQQQQKKQQDPKRARVSGATDACMDSILALSCPLR